MAILKLCQTHQNLPRLFSGRRPAILARKHCPNSTAAFTSARFYRMDASVFGCSAADKPSSAKSDNETVKAFLQQGVEEKSVKSLVNAYRRLGHLRAKLDPLELADGQKERMVELEPGTYGFEEDAMESPLVEGGQATLADMLAHLEELYAGNIAVEFMHLRNAEERQFFARLYEEQFREDVSASEKVKALELMLKMKAWEHFLALKFPTLKRYSGEGAESMVAFYRQMLEECPKHGIGELIWGGAHRGRIALQTILFQFPAAQIFRKIRGMTEFPANIDGMGDVLTHMHSHFDYEAASGDLVHVSTLPNPSHLEASISAVVGKARGRAQTMRVGDYGQGGVVGDAILPVHHHGDGAFTGQGIVWETLAMSQVPNFRVGGSIHLIVNNQLAFTADKTIGRSSVHSTDVAKALDCPVIHVNAENIERVLLAARLALAYRQQFRKEVFVELVCHRKYGHNELDDPRFTQPIMYQSVDAKKCLVDNFAEKLEAEGLMTEGERGKIVEEYNGELRRELDMVDSGGTQPIVDHLGGYWQGYQQAPKAITKWDTGLDIDLLKFIGAASVAIPQDITVHPHLQRMHIDGRLKKIAAGEVDWSTAEALALGSALLQGFDVRLCGQDVGRATFSHRHAMVVCQRTDRVHIPLNHIKPDDQNSFIEIANSPLSEAAVLGFEYGMAIENPQRLVIWEAQFGDFYNGAQIQFDTLIASGESKWLLQNGLVLLLPHGFDGAGPDHSSAHIERFLSLSDSSESQSPPDGDNVNWTVAHPTTSAQYFHLLRRQIVTPFRKPLVIIAPKLLLRHSSTVRPLSDFTEGTTFQPVLRDPRVKEAKKVTKVILCSGKHAVILAEERKKRQLEENVAIVRLEGICPFPVDDLSTIFAEYPNAKTFIWSQEEPRNAGCWPFVQPRFRNAFNIPLIYCGRPEQAWMASAIAEVHKNEIDAVMNSTFSQ